MSIKQILVCDKCGKELKGRLTSRKCPCCGADICLECMEAANKKEEPEKPKRKLILSGSYESQNLKIHVPAEDETDYSVKILDVETAGAVLRLAVVACLEAWGGIIPDKLDDMDRRTLEGILAATL